MALPRLADTLAGRIEILTLHPFTQGEMARVRGSARRTAWFRSYVETATERTVRDVAEISGLPDLRRLLAALAYRSGSLVNAADLSRTLGLPQTTLKRYLALLEIAFLLKRLPAWSANLTTRLVKTPKMYITDSGLLAHLLAADAQRLRDEPALFGQVLENFVVGEIDRQSTWSDLPVSLMHYRTHVGREVDLVLEDDRGRIVGIEVKATASPAASDFKGLRSLADAAGDRFQRGVLLCLSDTAVPFGPRLQTLPASALWDG